MTLEAFQEIISLIKKNSVKIDKIYKLGLDIINFQDDLNQVITILLKSHYSKIGEEVISYWLWEDLVELFDNDGNKTHDLTSIEDLWKYVEDIRKSADFEEFNPEKTKKLTKKQIEKIFKSFL